MLRSPNADDATVWLDGELQAEASVAVHGLTHALHYGSSVFEGIRLYPTPRGPAIFRLQDHIARLYRGARTYGLEMPYGEERFCEIVAEVAKISRRDAAYIRPLAFFGVGLFSFATRKVIVFVPAWKLALLAFSVKAEVVLYS